MLTWKQQGINTRLVLQVAMHSHAIADEIVLILSDFTTLLSSLSEPAPNARYVPVEAFGRELERFKIWVGNIGAHRRGQSSLDYRLRDASHIQNTVLELLAMLRQAMVEG
jgi:hypothetical protein